MAERVRRIGGTTIRSISHISQLQTIANDNDEFVLPEQMVQNLINDNRQIAEMQRRLTSVMSTTMWQLATSWKKFSTRPRSASGSCMKLVKAVITWNSCSLIH